MTDTKTIREPLLHISKRDVLPIWKVVSIYFGAIVFGLLLCGLICTITFGASPLEVYKGILDGNLKLFRNRMLLLQETSLLLLVGLALAPAFKMKFWNLGGNGQILMGCLACIACMRSFGGKLPDPLVWIMMIIASIVVGSIWAVIPAIFKAKWNTNESLFTLMMNYIASGLVAFAISSWVKSGSGTLKPIEEANLPYIGDPATYGKYTLIILCAILVTVFMYFYLKDSKHGFEVSLVGESQNTAKYVGISVKKTVIRTLILSGGICGLVGLLLGGAINHTININSANNMGFTAIMVVWFAKCNPLLMVISSFGIIFLSKGMKQVQTNFGVTNTAVSDMIVGLIYFIIIGCEFFIVYKLKISKLKKNKESGFIETKNEDRGNK